MLAIKKIKFLFLAALFSFCFITKAQTNLVNNPSFETYSNCPIGLNSGVPDEMAKATSWYSMKDTPDYFNSCATSTDVLVPKNAAGYQNAATGNAYGGFIAYDKLGFAREILGQQLSLTLSQGQTYYVAMKVCLAEFSTSVSEYMPCGKIGIRFSTVLCSITAPPPINNLAHVKTTSIISDTTNWTLISGSFVADSSYKYLMIGNFYDDFNTDTLSNPPYGHRSYYYVDDVCVSTSSLTCQLLTAIKEPNSYERILIYPNPFISDLIIEDIENDNCTVIIFDLFGKKILQKDFTTKTSVNLSELTPGTYLLQFKSSKECLTKKIIKTP